MQIMTWVPIVAPHNRIYALYEEARYNILTGKVRKLRSTENYQVELITVPDNLPISNLKSYIDTVLLIQPT